jgi:hypothetical protein
MTIRSGFGGLSQTTLHSILSRLWLPADIGEGCGPVSPLRPRHDFR